MVKNIIFDLGNVIVDLNVAGCHQAFRDLGGDLDRLFTLPAQAAEYKPFEVGKMTLDEFHALFRTHLNIQANPEQINAAFNIMIQGIQKKRIDLLQKLRHDYRLFIFSNTNVVHVNYINQHLQQQFNIRDFNVLVEKAYYSHEIGQRKPDAAGYQFILADQQLTPHETLFVDDVYANVETAQNLGMQVLHKPAAEDVEELLLQRLQL